MEENNQPPKPKLEELLRLKGQLRREIALANERRVPTLSAKRKLAVVNKEIAKTKSGKTRGDLFDTQLDLF